MKACHITLVLISLTTAASLVGFYQCLPTNYTRSGVRRKDGGEEQEHDFPEQVVWKTAANNSVPNIEARGEWQQQQVDAYCEKYGLGMIKYTFPRDRTSRKRLFKHLIYNDDVKLLFGYIPKVGCTNIRRFVLLLSGILPLESVQWRRPLNETQRSTIKRGSLASSFLAHSMSNSEKLSRLQQYYKVSVLRNPLERLLSAFRDKLERPVAHGNDSWETRTKLEIAQHYAQQAGFERLSNVSVLNVSFAQFLQWVIDKNNSQLNEHFAPQIENIYPCRVRYHFYGNFNQLGNDMSQIMMKLHVPQEYYLNQSYHDSSLQTTNLLQSYYSNVDSNIRLALLDDFQQELDFYYSLFPSEINSLKLLDPNL